MVIYHHPDAWTILLYRGDFGCVGISGHCTSSIRVVTGVMHTYAFRDQIEPASCQTTSQLLNRLIISTASLIIDHPHGSVLFCV